MDDTMKYKIQNIIILEELENETVHDIIYHELDEQEFLVEYLKNPRLIYWQIEDDGTKHHYKDGKLMVTIRDGIVVNHTMKKYP